MSDILGTNVAAPIVPFTTDDDYPTHDEQYGAGGWRTVANPAALDAIPAERRRDGMAVFVRSTGLVYIYKASTTSFVVFTNFNNFLSTLVFSLWSELSGYAAANPGLTLNDGFAARVVGDAGTHVDPVTSATVSNTGVFRYHATAPVGWTRVSNLEATDISAMLDEVEQHATDAADSATLAGQLAASLSSVPITQGIDPATANNGLASGLTVFSKVAIATTGFLRSVSVYANAALTGAKLCIVEVNGDGTVKLVASKDVVLTDGVNALTWRTPVVTGQFVALYTPQGVGVFSGGAGPWDGAWTTTGLPAGSSSGSTPKTANNIVSVAMRWSVDSQLSDKLNTLDVTYGGQVGLKAVGPGPMATTGTAFANATFYGWPQILSDSGQFISEVVVPIQSAGQIRVIVAFVESDGTLSLVSSTALSTGGTGVRVIVPDAPIFVPAGCIAGLAYDTANGYYDTGGTPGAVAIWSTAGGTIPSSHTPKTAGTGPWVKFQFTVIGETRGRASLAYAETVALRAIIGQSRDLGWPEPIATTGTNLSGAYTIMDVRPATADGVLTQVKIGATQSGTVKIFTGTVDPTTRVLTLKEQSVVNVVAGLNTISLTLPVTAGDLIGASTQGTSGTMLFQLNTNPDGVSVWCLGSSVTNGMTFTPISAQHRFEFKATVKTGLLAQSGGGSIAATNTGLDTLAGASSSGDFASALASAYSAHPNPYLRPGNYNATALPAYGKGLWGPGKLYLNGVYVSIPSAPERGSRFLKLRSLLAGTIANGGCLIFMGDSITNGAYATDHRKNHVGLMARGANMGIALDEAVMGSFDDSDPSGGLSFHGLSLSNPSTATQGTGGPVGKSLMLQPGQTLSMAAAAYERVDVTYTGVTGGTLVFAYNGITYKTVNCATTGQDVLAAAGPTGQTASGVYSITNTGTAAVEITSLGRFGVKAVGSKPRLIVCRFARGGWSFGSYSAAQIQSAVRIANVIGGNGTASEHFVVTALGTNDSVGGSATYAQIKTAATNHANLWIAAGVPANKQMPAIPWRWSYYLGSTTYEMAQGGVRDGFRAAGVTACIQTDAHDFVSEGLAGDGHPSDLGFQVYYDQILASMCQARL